MVTCKPMVMRLIVRCASRKGLPGSGAAPEGIKDHARRKFKDAQKGEKPPGKGNPGQKTSLATTALAKIARLYANEKVIKETTHDDKRQYRQQHSVPVLEDIKVWLDANIHRVEPGSLIHNAIGYALNQWPKLIVYSATAPALLYLLHPCSRVKMAG